MVPPTGHSWQDRDSFRPSWGSNRLKIDSLSFRWVISCMSRRLTDDWPCTLSSSSSQPHVSKQHVWAFGRALGENKLFPLTLPSPLPLPTPCGRVEIGYKSLCIYSSCCHNSWPLQIAVVKRAVRNKRKVIFFTLAGKGWYQSKALD